MALIKVTPKRVIQYVVAAFIACTLGLSSAHGQAAGAGSDQKPLLAEDVFKNVQILRGMPVKDFMNTMGFISAATGMNCIDCHSPEASASLDGYAVDTPLKQTARKMILMVNALNKANFGGERKVTCYTCHRATDHPDPVPSLLDQYSIAPDDPNKVQILDSGAVQTAKISADQILDKYVQALGGAALVSKLASITAKGTYEGYETYHVKVPFEVYASAPDQLTTVVHTQQGDSVNTYDGTHGWSAAADKLMRVLPLFDGDLAGAKMDASVLFPAGLKQEFKWRTGFPSVTINDRPVQVIQVADGGDSAPKLYFDKATGLLVRQVRYADTAIGPIPTQIDYSDYRLVAGVKIPFHWVVTWTDNKALIQLNVVQPNAKVDAAKFAMPAPPKHKTATP